MRTPLWVMVGSLALGTVVACGPPVELEDGSTAAEESGGATTTGTTTTPPSPSTTAPLPSTTAPPEPTETEGDDTWGPLIDLQSGPCSLYDQDCPEGEKCMPWADDGGGIWNATRCTPIVDDPDAVGESCTLEGGPTRGLDSCEGGAICWDVSLETLEGTCTAFCGGSLEEPTCEDAGSSCLVTGGGPFELCIPSCDPLAQDCGEGEACYGVNGIFICTVDASGDLGEPGDACEFINACDPGSACATADLVPDCTGIGCCTAFCDLTDGMPPCLPGQVCTPWYDPATVPAGYEDVGLCALP